MPTDVPALGAGWRKANRSVNNGACVELASAGTQVLVRDSTNRGGLVLSYSANGWRAFLAVAKSGSHDMHR